MCGCGSVVSVRQKCVIVWFPHGVDTWQAERFRYAVASLSCCTKIFCASHKHVSRMFSLADFALKNQFSDILAPALTEVLSQSFRESKVPRIWKLADVPPVPKGASTEDFNKELRPISLTHYIVQSRGGVCHRPRTHCVRTHLHATSLVWSHWWD